MTSAKQQAMAVIVRDNDCLTVKLVWLAFLPFVPLKDMLPNCCLLKLQLVVTPQISQLLLLTDMHSRVTASQLLCKACCYHMHRSSSSSWPGYCATYLL